MDAYFFSECILLLCLLESHRFNVVHINFGGFFQNDKRLAWLWAITIYFGRTGATLLPVLLGFSVDKGNSWRPKNKGPPLLLYHYGLDSTPMSVQLASVGGHSIRRQKTSDTDKNFKHSRSGQHFQKCGPNPIVG